MGYNATYSYLTSGNAAKIRSHKYKRGGGEASGVRDGYLSINLSVPDILHILYLNLTITPLIERKKPSQA